MQECLLLLGNLFWILHNWNEGRAVLGIHPKGRWPLSATAVLNTVPAGTCTALLLASECPAQKLSMGVGFTDREAVAIADPVLYPPDITTDIPDSGRCRITHTHGAYTEWVQKALLQKLTKGCKCWGKQTEELRRWHSKHIPP